MCSSSGGKLFDYNFLYNHPVVVAVRYAGQDGTHFHLDLHTGRTLTQDYTRSCINPLNAELNPICCLLALLGAHHFLYVSRIRVNKLSS